MHIAAVAAMENIICVKCGDIGVIGNHLNQKQLEIINKNSQKLLPIIKTVAFCGKQTIALRGHRDDDTVQDESINKGNFQELLNFRNGTKKRYLQK